MNKDDTVQKRQQKRKDRKNEESIDKYNIGNSNNSDINSRKDTNG